MYGLLLENLSEFIKQAYGEERWEEIRRQCNVEQPSFSVHQVFPETLLPKLAKKAIQILGVSEREFFDGMGVYFVRFVGQYGYDRVLSVLGRHMRDFLNGLDNLHEYLKFSYPRMRAPSFICENETREGLTLHYRSKRRGFVYYTMGQIREVSRHFYHKDMKIDLIREEMMFDTLHVTFQLTFDNIAFGQSSLTLTREEKHLPVSANVLFEIFPFCIVFGSDMVIRSIGNSLTQILPDLVGKKITNWFDLVRPLIAFKFNTILNRTNNIFELVSVEPVIPDKEDKSKREETLFSDTADTETVEDKNLHLKGQMIYMDNWRMMMYLGTPVMPDLNSLVSTGLYINDLSMHDFSRDLMLAGTQQSVELKLALDQEQQKSKKLEESMRKLDEEMRRTDELLYQMIPKQVADRLRKGENPIDTCEIFDSVSVLFSDVVTFTEICSRITPMEVVSMLNAMYSIFDNLTERNKVYKVETIGDAYMVVAGAPDKDARHAEKVCDMALDMVDAIQDLKDPSTGSHLQIRVGVHSGAVVAGIVGLKMPRYCLFGDSVNTASRMESTSAAMQIHLSQTTKDLLPNTYEFTERSEIAVKGKGNMKTYWLVSRANRVPLQHGEALKAGSGASSPQPGELADGEGGDGGSADKRGVYSPVTFQDVALRSANNSPAHSSSRRESGNTLMAVNARHNSVLLDPIELGDSIHLPGSTGATPVQSPPIPVGVPLNREPMQAPDPPAIIAATTAAAKISLSAKARRTSSPKAVQTEWTEVWDKAMKRSKDKKQKQQKERTISMSTSDSSIHAKSRNQVVPNSTSDHHHLGTTLRGGCHGEGASALGPVEAFQAQHIPSSDHHHHHMCSRAPPPSQPQHHHHHHCCSGFAPKQRVTSNTCGLL